MTVRLCSVTHYTFIR